MFFYADLTDMRAMRTRGPVLLMPTGRWTCQRRKRSVPLSIRTLLTRAVNASLF